MRRTFFVDGNLCNATLLCATWSLRAASPTTSATRLIATLPNVIVFLRDARLAPWRSYLLRCEALLHVESVKFLAALVGILLFPECVCFTIGPMRAHAFSPLAAPSPFIQALVIAISHLCLGGLEGGSGCVSSALLPGVETALTLGNVERRHVSGLAPLVFLEAKTLQPSLVIKNPITATRRVHCLLLAHLMGKLHLTTRRFSLLRRHFPDPFEIVLATEDAVITSVLPSSKHFTSPKLLRRLNRLDDAFRGKQRVTRGRLGCCVIRALPIFAKPKG